jgi:cytoskeleton-associated protein 5
VGLDAVNAFLGIADADAARAHAGAVMAAVVAKGMSGRPKTVERATETCLLLCELECAEVVVAALVEKGTKHKVPKCALASTEALRAALASFGTGVVPPKPILKGIAHLFESKDGKVRDAAKELTVELTRWLGVDAARKDLLEKMRAGMRAEVEASVAKAGVGSARATRLTRKDRANGVFVSAGDDSTPMDVDGDDAAAPSAAAPAPLPDAYEFADPESVLDKLEKAPADKEQPKFWDAVGSGKWKERLGALSQLRALADHPKLASGEYGDVARALKKVVTKDSNIACVGEACAAAGALAEGLRREFRSEARLLLPGMLDKLKDKNTSVVSKNRDALLVFSRRCFSVVEAADDIAAALKHKFPKVPAQTLGWLAAAADAPEFCKATAAAAHKALLPAVVRCADHKEPDVRAAAIEALAALGRAGGGWRSIARHVDALDEAKKAKVEEACGAARAQTNVSAPAPKHAGASFRPLSTLDANAPAQRRVAASGKSGKPGGAGPREGAAAVRPSAGPGAAAAAPAEKLDVDPAPPLSKEEAAERLSSMYGAEVPGQLASGAWKERLAGMATVAEAIKAMAPAACDAAAENTVRALAATPGFDDKNFQVLGKAFDALGSLAAKAPAFSQRDGARVVAAVAEKLADVKLRGPGANALTSVSEALGPSFVLARLRRSADSHKNPKVTSEALLFCASLLGEFGVHACGIPQVIDWCKASLGLTNPACKAAAAKALGAMHAGVGPGLRDFLGELKEAQMKAVEVEFARNPFEVTEKVTRVVRKSSSGGSSGSSVPVASDGLPRADVSALVTEKLIADMGDANWKNRAAAVECVGGILADAGFRIAPNTGDLMPALGKRFADSNRILAANALAMAGKAAAAIGPAVAERRHGHGLAGEMTRQMGDSKPSVRAAAAGALDAWAIAAGLEKTLPVVADKMVDLAGKMSGDGKADALAWTLRALAAGDCGDDADVLAAAVAAAAVGLADNKAQARAAGGRVMDEVLARVGPKRAMAMSREMTAPAAMKAAAAAHVDKNKADFVAGDGGAPEPSSSPTLPPRPATARVGSVRGSTTGISSLRASRPGTARGGVASSTSSFSAPKEGPAPDGAALRRDDDKDARARKLPKKPVKFETLRDDQLKLAEAELKTALAPYVRSDVHALLFGTGFKAHMSAVEHLEACLEASPELVPGNLDLLLRWVVLRFCEQAPNTQSLLRVLDLARSLLAVVKAQGERLSDQEAALFLPALVDKSGHAMEAAREKFRAVLRLVPGVFPASRAAGYLVRGLDSKNTKTRLGDAGRARAAHGEARPGSRRERRLQGDGGGGQARRRPRRAHARRRARLPDVRVQGGGRGRVAAHRPRRAARARGAGGQVRQVGEGRWPGTEEGAPGAWMRGGVPVGGGAAPGAASRSSAAKSPGRLAATATAVGSPIAAVASAVLRPFGAAVSSFVRRDRAHEHGEPSDAALMDCEEAPGPPAAAAALAGWRRALETVASGADAAAVEGMKCLCHEVMGVVGSGDDAALAVMASDVDALVSDLAARVAPIFDAAAAAPGASTARACKYVLNALMQVFQEPRLASAVGQASEQRCIAALLERLLDPRSAEMEEGPALVKALNVLMLKVLEHCDRTASFESLLRLLATPPATVAADAGAAARFRELVVKCLIKLTKALGATLCEVRLPELLLEIHRYFDALGEEEIRRRGRAADGGDKPLRMVKTILHKLTEMVGHDIHDAFTLCPPRGSTPAPIVYAYVDLNLQSMPDAPGTPRAFASDLNRSAGAETAARDPGPRAGAGADARDPETGVAATKESRRGASCCGGRDDAETGVRV